MSDLVYWSVFECNRLHGREVKSHGIKCSCGADKWRTFWGVDPQYKSEFNPGEFCRFTCVECGYSYESPS